MDSEAMCQHVFSRVPAEHFHNPMLAFELVQFCRDSLPLLGRNLSTLRRSFPSLLKARAGRGRGAVSRAPCPGGSGRAAWSAGMGTSVSASQVNGLHPAEPVGSSREGEAPRV